MRLKVNVSMVLTPGFIRIIRLNIIRVPMSHIFEFVFRLENIKEFMT